MRSSLVRLTERVKKLDNIYDIRLTAFITAYNHRMTRRWSGIETWTEEMDLDCYRFAARFADIFFPKS